MPGQSASNSVTVDNNKVLAKIKQDIANSRKRNSSAGVLWSDDFNKENYKDVTIQDEMKADYEVQSTSSFNEGCYSYETKTTEPEPVITKSKQIIKTKSTIKNIKEKKQKATQKKMTAKSIFKAVKVNRTSKDS